MNPTHLELLLRLAAAAQVLVALLNLLLSRIMNWKRDLEAMPLLVREVFVIHSWFISLTLAIFGALTWRFAGEMVLAPTAMSRWLCLAIALFWGLRCALQWLHYDRSHWRGNAGRTAIHWLLFGVYGAWSVTYAMAGAAI